ncbi:hypothetical protein BGZ89_007604, partial [Linnemannia elongata]
MADVENAPGIIAPTSPVPSNPQETSEPASPIVADVHSESQSESPAPVDHSTETLDHNDDEAVSSTPAPEDAGVIVPASPSNSAASAKTSSTPASPSSKPGAAASAPSSVAAR